MTNNADIHEYAPGAMAEDAGQEPAETVMRLQKYLARAGVASRRASEKLITQGRVTVDGVVVDELGAKVDAATQVVCVDGAPVNIQPAQVTIMLNKPAGYVTTMDDPQGRPCVASLVPLDEYPSLYPVGRLDCDTTGLLLFSTDGELGNLLLHPRHHVQKTYLAFTLGVPTDEALACLRAGVELSDGMTQPAEVELLQGAQEQAAFAEFGFDQQKASGTGNAAKKLSRTRAAKATPKAVVRITIREGRNRQVRRMFEAVGCPVIALHRCEFGGLELGGLERGAWRLLTEQECALLQNALS